MFFSGAWALAKLQIGPSVTFVLQNVGTDVRQVGLYLLHAIGTNVGLGTLIFPGKRASNVLQTWLQNCQREGDLDDPPR